MTMPAETLTARPTLADLLHGLADAPPLPLADIASDSRRLRAGGLFLACRGARSHALDHLDAGEAARLAAIAWDGDATATPPAGVPAVAVPDLRRYLGDIADRYFDDPSAVVAIDAVTGTNGKTTVAWLLAQAREGLGQACGYVGTLGAGLGTVEDSASLTTPDAVEIRRLLAGFRDAGARHAAIEASSHGLGQGRLDGLRIATAVFTNLSRDHIDYHGDMQRYGEAKARLFADFAPRQRVICIDTDFGRELAARHDGDAVLVASRPGVAPGRSRYVIANAIAPVPAGTRVEFATSAGSGSVTLGLVGDFNVANAGCVLATLLADGVDFADALELLASLTPPPGRLQAVAPGDGQPRVFVDYAHTPAALDAALAALRPHCGGRLWCVFGCGGERDRGKRPEMGRVVARLADEPLLTSDNPRGEDPAVIIADVQAGVAEPLAAIEDRATAIAFAIANAAADDVVLIAGKGHENYQLIGGRRLAFSDYAVAAENLERRR